MRLSCDDLPMFFSPEHRALGDRLRGLRGQLADIESAPDEAARDRAAATALATTGLFAMVAPAEVRELDPLAICLARELCGYVAPRADAILAVQGLGVHPLLLAGSPQQRAGVARFASGQEIAAFALTEPEAGSDVAALRCSAMRDDDGWILDGEKCFISNLGIATYAVVFATIDQTLGHRGITAFWLPLATTGVAIDAQAMTSPHPIGRMHLTRVRLPAEAVIGAPGDGFKLAMRTLDAFRVTVGAAAVGMARRALDEAVAHVKVRRQFGKPLAEQPMVQAHLADMALDLDCARLLTLRAAWLKASTAARATTEVSMAKLGATEAAHRVIDRAVQLLGGRGVTSGEVVEHLYRAIRPLRIYEGTSEIQRTIIGKSMVTGDGA
jgi:acyl-CoA dehydrogenase